LISSRRCRTDLTNMQRRNHGAMARRDARSNGTEMPRNPEYFRGYNVYEMAAKFCRSSLQGNTYREEPCIFVGQGLTRTVTIEPLPHTLP
jgi:hypothetical protein